MAFCCACGQEPASSADLMLARNGQGQWVTLCRACSERGVGATDLVPLDAGDGGDAFTQRAPAAAPPVDPFAAVAQLLARIRSQRRKDMLRPHTRVHERHSVDLSIRYHLERDDIFHAGQVRDLSGGGLQMVSDHPLTVGQLIHFDGQMPLPAVLLDLFRGAAEVRRAREMADGRWEIGARFIQRQAAKGMNRRQHRRYATHMLVLYRRAGSDITAMADVVDLSQGGMMLHSGEPLILGEEVDIRLRGDSGSFARGDLVGHAEVLRVIARPGYQEIGCRFMLTRIEPRRSAEFRMSTGRMDTQPPPPPPTAPLAGPAQG